MPKLLYVEFRQPRSFRPIPLEGKVYGHNINLGTSVQGPILFGYPGTGDHYGWDLQRAGTSLVMTKGGITYECPWDDVKMALQAPEPEAAKGAKPAGKAAQ